MILRDSVTGLPVRAARREQLLLEFCLDWLQHRPGRLPDTAGRGLRCLRLHLLPLCAGAVAPGRHLPAALLNLSSIPPHLLTRLEADVKELHRKPDQLYRLTEAGSGRNPHWRTAATREASGGLCDCLVIRSD